MVFSEPPAIKMGRDGATNLWLENPLEGLAPRAIRV